jgi:hypothetical protein
MRFTGCSESPLNACFEWLRSRIWESGIPLCGMNQPSLEGDFCG